jgi:hypothetical protein
MTLLKVMQLALRRVGLDETASAFQDNARDYFNLGTKDLSSRRAWRWLFKTTSFTTVSGTRTYSLASDVMRPLSFFNVTDNFTMQLRNPELADRLDPDQDDSGEPRIVAVSGINTSTGYWEVDLFPNPDDSATSIRYRYFSYITDKTSANDATDLAPTMPQWAQLAMVHYIASLYKGELGDIDGERGEFQLYEQAIINALKVDGEAEAGSRVDRLPRHPIDAGLNADFTFYINEGSLS